MRLLIRNDRLEASEYVAEYIIRRINAFAPTPSSPFILGLPTGSSPELVYASLVVAHRAGRVSFANVVTFNMDEYVGLPRAHPQSYHSFMYHHFFSHVDIDPKNVHILDGNAPDLEAECDRYEDRIREYGGIELFLGGIGPDGHIAFNEPGSSLSSRTRVKTLTYDTILANSRFFDDDVSKVPRMALTVGVGTILDAKEVVIIITGAHKAVALQKCIEGPINHMWTLSSLQLHKHPMIVVDDDATLELQVKTVKYFKSIEAVGKECGFEQLLPRQVLSAPVSPKFRPRSDEGEPGLLPQNVPVVRAPTPDIVPDSMGSRLKEDGGMVKVGDELSIQSMHSRMPRAM
jgi:glucosamine-6-phosphate deaminase